MQPWQMLQYLAQSAAWGKGGWDQGGKGDWQGRKAKGKGKASGPGGNWGHDAKGAKGKGKGKGKQG